MLGVDGSLVGFGKKNNSFFQISYLEKGLQIVTFVANRLLAWYAALKRGQGVSFRKQQRAKCPTPKEKRQIRGRQIGRHRAKGPSIRGFLADQCRARGYLGPGAHQKRKGVPPLEKRIESIPTQIRGEGVKKFLRAPLLYD